MRIFMRRRQTFLRFSKRNWCWIFLENVCKNHRGNFPRRTTEGILIEIREEMPRGSLEGIHGKILRKIHLTCLHKCLMGDSLWECSSRGFFKYSYTNPYCDCKIIPVIVPKEFHPVIQVHSTRNSWINTSSIPAEICHDDFRKNT